MRYESYASQSFLSVSTTLQEFYPGCMESSEVRSRDAGQTPMRSGFCARCKCPTMRNPSDLRQMASVHGRTEERVFGRPGPEDHGDRASLYTRRRTSGVANIY